MNAQSRGGEVEINVVPEMVVQGGTESDIIPTSYTHKWQRNEQEETKFTTDRIKNEVSQVGGYQDRGQNTFRSEFVRPQKRLRLSDETSLHQRSTAHSQSHPLTTVKTEPDTQKREKNEVIRGPETSLPTPGSKKPSHAEADAMLDNTSSTGSNKDKKKSKSKKKNKEKGKDDKVKQQTDDRLPFDDDSEFDRIARAAFNDDEWW
jgi:hypothetical protein